MILGQNQWLKLEERKQKNWIKNNNFKKSLPYFVNYFYYLLSSVVMPHLPSSSVMNICAISSRSFVFNSQSTNDDDDNHKHYYH